MDKQLPKYAYAIAIGIGIFAFFLANSMASAEMSLLKRAFCDTAIFIFFGTLVSLFWPICTWKWGLWLAMPAAFFTGMNLLFAGGHLDIFFQIDLPILITILLAGSVGSMIGCTIRDIGQKKKKSGTLE
ncbi:MAG: hypothetical protein JKZ03_06180 [Flavobacteriaceae bacterium]|nr:hypothetical protein [Flavobacteriaceae bacterium]